MKVGVFGLGSMGYGMASSLVRAGHEVFGADVNHEAVKRLHANGGSTTELGAAARELDAVVVVVLNSAQTEEVLFGKDGIVSKLSPGAVVTMCVTVAPEYARKAAERCSALGIHFLDAPISGGSVKAANGKLSIMASGTPEAFSRARPALDAMAEKVFELGDAAGAGSAIKAVNQMLAGTHIAAMAEAITFGITQGIDPETFLKVIPQCAGTSWMLENRAPHVAAGDYTPHSAIDIWPKDLGIVLDVARASKFSAPLTAAALQQFVAASGMGLGREDDAAVAKIYARNAGIELPGVKSGS
ncbi:MULTISPECIES: L-threonate dehydrogenase [Rhizobium]|uniref:L-threonate dehydrogenase n=1 Tax=Rhizobium favelukesii TaxID=348824 RepID=W6RPS6_9HYPH|nr:MULTISPECIES: L-threonate dehydrogenase [Rhizobium]MCA0805200.1 NAD(P)-dependent oxidoreductase [Rhizobium sp. T1473]MCS0462874.1 NAD(P)-dependent oxidoreductase [Rhizobium favelukesii]UFS79465.1 NAD(P)-dependent oxidoreductase [Rhizobium sp. T136]CDM63047.1 putative oxidoreductase ygbJ [Rhizobium favelukesii]